ncbi:hypothetical protein B0H16DRAFT_1557108 [Mycena metata]|uniref:Uncharacterized protein n=1 Tax=Mycena metata TaxID=1033252 RepID=A0AAD7IMR9_9AGAR|nr:hypothetical protein B0H16DRAFT_1557108 [Mycena metata]
MAPGANYMGGKRNAARARSKDTTGRAHKNFFSRQRLDILSKGLSGGAPSGGSTSGLGPRITASDIDLSHAKHLAPGSSFDREDLVSRRVDTESTPSRPTHLTEETRSRIRSSSGSRSSRILEALDITEPLAMRAAMNKILSFPDLAGLSPGPRSPPSMKRQPKRQKTRVSPSPSLSDDQSLEELRHESMDVDDPVADASDEHYSETKTDREDGDFGLDVHSYSIHRPATPLSTTNKENAPSLPDPWNAIGFILGLEEDNQSGRTAKGCLSEDHFPARTSPNEHATELDRNSTDGHEINRASSPECVELEPLVYYHSDETTTTDDELLSPPSGAPPPVPEIPSKFLSPVLRPIAPNADLRDVRKFVY